ncbi:hypothetical protein [Haliscomenobacter sp.]|uniref:hypothetical protein n=1 Tax=Haliscomenobacter sp. TaxID=2717303 RepID=UPI003364E470
MLQKVFVLENFESSNIALNSPLIANYWGSNFGSIKFLGHTSYLNRLAAKTGYFALKVTRIYDQDGVDGHWVSFDLADIEKINASKSKTRYFVIKKTALDAIIALDPNANSIGAEIGIEHIGIKKVYTLIIGAATFEYISGGGTGSPSAGAKIPPNQ